jgi:hypothetical protein
MRKRRLNGYFTFFRVSPYSLNWEDAEAECKQEGGHLAYINSLAVRKLLAFLMKFSNFLRPRIKCLYLLVLYYNCTENDNQNMEVKVKYLTGTEWSLKFDQVELNI